MGSGVPTRPIGAHEIIKESGRCPPFDVCGLIFVCSLRVCLWGSGVGAGEWSSGPFRGVHLTGNAR